MIIQKWSLECIPESREDERNDLREEMLIDMSHGKDAISGTCEKDKSVAIQGRITVSNSGEMRTRLADALRSKPESISVNLSGVPYMDTSGVATLIEAARMARSQGTRLILDGIHDQPRYFFDITHLDRLFEIRAQETSP